MSRPFRIANVVLALVFAVGALVQLNDPDPLAWVAMYLAAALACGLAAAGRLAWRIPALVGAVALVWSLALAPVVLGQVGAGELVETWQMKDVRVERGREMYGLLLILAWMAVLTVVAIRRRETPAASA